MSKELKPVDITHATLPDLLHLVDEVQATQEPRLLKRGEKGVAVLAPVQEKSSKTRSAKRTRRRLPDNRWLLNLVGIADEAIAEDAPTDVSSNKYKYLAEAYYAESHKPQDK
jgi:hypothetical protein